MHVLGLRMDLRLPGVDSLKEKRSTITPILEGARRRYRVASAEVDRNDDLRRAVLGFSTVSGSAAHAREIMDDVERFVWSFPEVEVVAASHAWAEDDDR